MRIIVTLLLIAGLIAGYFKFEEWRKVRTEKFWAAECRSRIEPLMRRQGKDLSVQPDQAAFFKLLHFLLKAKAAGTDISKMASGACELLGLPGDAADVVKNSLEENIAKAQKLQLADDTINMINLENGDEVMVKCEGWQGEKAGVGQIVPVALAPEAACHLGNLLVMPASVRDAQGKTVTESVVTRAIALERMKVITRESLERVKAAGTPQK